MRRITLATVSITLLADIYIWWRYLINAPLWLHALWWLPTCVLLLTIIELYWRRRHHTLSIRLLFSILLCVSLPKVCFALFSLFLGWPFGLIACAVVLLCAIYGFTWGPRRLKIRHEQASWPSLPPSFDGYRIVHLSDFHLGSLGRRSSVIARLVQRVNAEGADLVVFTGDLINRSAEELTPYISILSTLQVRDGIYAVLGNHDFVANADKLCSVIGQTGWQTLRNRSVELHRNGEHITLIGVDNISDWVFASHGNLIEAMEGVDSDSFQVLLSHDPAHWRKEVSGATRIQLTLSGHTHAGQFRIGRWSLANLFAREWWGWYSRGSQCLHVSAGVSGLFPFRLGAWPELTVITIHNSSFHIQNSSTPQSTIIQL